MVARPFPDGLRNFGGGRRRGAHQASSALAEQPSGLFARAQDCLSDWAPRRRPPDSRHEKRNHGNGRIDHRPSWDEYFMTLANEVATRTTCLRRGVGAVIVKDRRILATGYNGVPTGMAHCAETGCLRQQLGVPSGQRHEICRGLHAEQNAIIQAARYGINITGASIYVNTQPCVVCAKMLINAGIEEIVYQNPYPDELFHVHARRSRHEGARVRGCPSRRRGVARPAAAGVPTPGTTAGAGRDWSRPARARGDGSWAGFPSAFARSRRTANCHVKSTKCASRFPPRSMRPLTQNFGGICHLPVRDSGTSVIIRSGLTLGVTARKRRRTKVRSW